MTRLNLQKLKACAARAVLRLVNACILLITAAPAILWLLTIALAKHIAAKCGKTAPSAFLYLSAAGSKTASLSKFGSLSSLYSYDGLIEKDFVDAVELFWFPAPSWIREAGEHGWVINEGKEFPVPFHKLGFILNLMRMASLIVRYEVKMIRAFDPYFSGLAGLLLARIYRVPLCVSLHADYDKMFELDGIRGAPVILGSRRLAKRLERFILHQADQVIAVTAYIGEYAVRSGSPRERLAIFRHFIDLENLGQPLTHDPRPPGSPVIAVISRLSAQKHVLDAILIAARLKEQGIDFRMEIAGDGELRPDMEARLVAADLVDQVHLKGFISRPEVGDLLRKASACLVLHGGASLAEACAAGCPVVAYDWEWHSELIEDGRSGWLVPEGDWRAAADRIGELLANPSRAAAMAIQAKQSTETLYDHEQLRQFRHSVYTSLIRSTGSPEHPRQ